MKATRRDNTEPTRLGIGTAIMVLLVGFSWAMESVLGKITLERGYSNFDFPIALNGDTVVLCLAACLHPQARQRVFHLTKPTLVTLAATALTLIFAPYLIIYLALATITPAETSLITSMTPVFSLLIGAVWFATGLRVRTVACVLVGFCGVGILIIQQISDPTAGAKTLWYLVMLIVPLCYAGSGFLIRRASWLGAGYLDTLLVTNLIRWCCSPC